MNNIRDNKAIKVILYILDFIILIIVILAHTNIFRIDRREILSGSMIPTYNIGDVVYSYRSDFNKLDIGDVIIYKIGDNDICHRIINKNEYGLTTKGDASIEEDHILITEDSYEGKVLFSLSNGSLFYSFISSIAFKVFVMILIILNIVLL